jgi:hypothetical protein
MRFAIAEIPPVFFLETYNSSIKSQIQEKFNGAARVRKSQAVSRSREA